MLEKFCDKLHQLTEQQFDEFLDPNILDKSPFYQYRNELKNMTGTTQRFYKGMLEGIEEL